MHVPVSPSTYLLAAVRRYLATEILPGLRDEKWFHVRVALNALAIVERELELGPEADTSERARLAGLPGEDGSRAELNRKLALAVRAGTLSAEDPALLDHLRRTTA